MGLFGDHFPPQMLPVFMPAFAAQKWAAKSAVQTGARFNCDACLLHCAFWRGLPHLNWPERRRQARAAAGRDRIGCTRPELWLPRLRDPTRQQPLATTTSTKPRKGRPLRNNLDIFRGRPASCPRRFNCPGSRLGIPPGRQTNPPALRHTQAD